MCIFKYTYILPSSSGRAQKQMRIPSFPTLVSSLILFCLFDPTYIFSLFVIIQKETGSTFIAVLNMLFSIPSLCPDVIPKDNSKGLCPEPLLYFSLAKVRPTF